MELGCRQERKPWEEGDPEEAASRCGVTEQAESIPSKGWVTTHPVVSVCSSEVLPSSGNHVLMLLRVAQVLLS